MTALTVKLLDDGAFEIASPFPGKRDYKIIHDGSHECLPWKVLSEMGESGIWREEDTFQSLDEALDWAVSLSSETFPVPGYGVTLPCGAFFSRPGNVKIEDVMAAIGWSYVVSVTGWSPKVYPKGTSRDTAVAYFEDLVEDTGAILGSVDICNKTDGEDDRGLDMWCADIVIPVSAFVRTEQAQEVFLEIFEEEGIPSTKYFDYECRVNVTPHSADVLDFSAAFEARKAAKSGSASRDSAVTA